MRGEREEETKFNRQPRQFKMSIREANFHKIKTNFFFTVWWLGFFLYQESGVEDVVPNFTWSWKHEPIT